MPRNATHARSAILAAALAFSLFALTAPAGAEEDNWPTLKEATFGDRAIQADDGKVILEAPTTAEDAALIPLTVRVPPEMKMRNQAVILFGLWP